MLAGELYDARDLELQADLTATQRWLARYNAALGASPAEQRQLLIERLGLVGDGAVIRPPFHCDYGFNISLGAGAFINFNCVILDVVEVSIGDGTQIGPAVQILAADHPRDPAVRTAGLEFGRPIRIGRNVWIGGGAIILPGVSIGDDALIGAGSVVTRDVPAGATAFGNPARVQNPDADRSRGKPDPRMKIATFNVNGVNGRLPVLLRWLAEAKPDIVCLQELKAPEEKFPAPALRKAGYGAIWHGQKSWNGVAILAHGVDPIETTRGLPGDPDDTQSRYIEAAVNGILVASIYLPNGNPAPGPKFDYKLRWFDRLISHAAELLAHEMPVVLAGDYNVMPTDLDVYAPERWRDDALFRPEVRSAFHHLIEQGWIDAVRTLHPDERIYTFWKYFRNAFARDAGLRIDHLLVSPSLGNRLIKAEVDSGVRGWEKASDHAPTWIELTDAAQADKARARRNPR